MAARSVIAALGLDNVEVLPGDVNAKPRMEAAMLSEPMVTRSLY
jgi:hypothetical protein